MGSGVSGSGLYVDPTSAPLRFARIAIGRVLVLIADSVLNVPAELSGAVSWTQPWIAAIGLLSLAGVMLWLRVAVRTAGEDQARSVRWLAVGALFALVPGAAGMPGGRLLLPSSLGAAAIFAFLLRDGLGRWRRATHAGRLGRASIAAATFALAMPNLVLAGPLLVGKMVAWKSIADSMRDEVCQPSLDASARVIVVWSDNPPAAVLGRAIRWFYGKGKTASWTVVSLAPGIQRLARPSPTDLILDMLEQPTLGSEWEVLFRSPERSMRVGDVVRQEGGLQIIVQAVQEGRPTQVLLRFPRPIESTDLRFLTARHGHMAVQALPPVGGSATIGAGK
jgi:hypothetical protein